MELLWLDWIIIAGYFGLTILVGLLFSKKAGQGIEEYFVSGRELPWWIAGTSIVATTFAADTPLLVTGLTIKEGIAGNWIWWCFAIAGMVMVFFFSRLWRRARVLTDIQLIEMRYHGTPAAALRLYRVFFTVVLMTNLFVGSITNAMLKVLKATVFWAPEGQLHFPAWMGNEASADAILIMILLGTTAVYSIISGLWGVVITDFIQFCLAMTGCIVLAIVGVNYIGGIDVLVSKISALPGGAGTLSFWPNFSGINPVVPLNIFLIMILVQWWASNYSDPSGNGQVVQRMSSCKNEKHALGATLWFTIAHYCVRPWPWIIIALVAMLIFPELMNWKENGIDPAEGFPMVIRVIAPMGLRGLMIVTFLAAYMSTISTGLNFNANYLVNDVYRRFIKPDASQKQLIKTGRIATGIVLLMYACSSFILRTLDVDQLMKIIAAFGAGAATVYMLRWYWWRVNAWSEIAAMVSGTVGFFVMEFVVKNVFPEVAWLQTFQYSMLIIAAFSISTWVIVTFLTSPTRTDVLEKFYRLARPSHYGWGPIAKRCPEIRSNAHMGWSAACVVLGAIMIYLTIPAIGLILFKKYAQAFACSSGAVVCGALIFWLMRKAGWNAPLDEDIAGNSSSGS